MDIISALARRLRFAAPALLCIALAGCSAGQRAQGFVNPRVMSAYVPLFRSTDFILGAWGAAVALTPNIAVTNDHNLNLVPPDRVVARSQDYDLLFFRIEGHDPPQFGNPRIGEPVVAYGQGSLRDLRDAKGAVSQLNTFVAPRCQDCRDQVAFTYDADAGEGFSGGPVVDANSGVVVGITFGFRDEGEHGARRMYAYDLALVLDEMRRLISNQTDSTDTTDSVQ
ncbi:MAG TPA: serine protease [Micropepsaceae bacterium]|nr:serine protease [Micropepsaceae bacterium]